jgi:basic membrane protein A
MPFAKREFVTLNRSDLAGRLKNPGPEKPGLIITVGFNYAADTQQLAKEHTDIRILAIDQSGIGSHNTQAYEITSYGQSYLAGALAASETKTGRVGIILGAQSGLLDAFRLGYIDPSVAVDVAYVSTSPNGGFSDPARAAEIARGMYQDGTDVIFTVAGFSGTGAISEAKKAPGRYIIGVDSDQTHLGPSVILASAVKRVDRVVYTGIGEYLNGTFAGGNRVAGLNEGVTGISCNPRFVACAQTVSIWEEQARDAEEKYLASRSNGG